MTLHRVFNETKPHGFCKALAKEGRYRLEEAFPDVFLGKRVAKVPLSHNIMVEAALALPDLDLDTLRFAVWDYLWGCRYLVAVANGGARFDIEGVKGEHVTLLERNAALLQLRRRESPYLARTTPFRAPSLQFLIATGAT